MRLPAIVVIIAAHAKIPKGFLGCHAFELQLFTLLPPPRVKPFRQ